MNALADDVKSIFGRVLELPDPAARAAYLAEVCGDNAALRAEVASLLVAIEQAGEFLQHVPVADDQAMAVAAGSPVTAAFGPNADVPKSNIPRKDEQAGAIVAGRYKLLQQIGEGGMGTVWMADQTEPVKRRVAVKLIRVEKGQSKTILSRFEAERQAIALMDHPHIAKLLDAGTAGGGQPFFVMELVKGLPLTDFSRRPQARHTGAAEAVHGNLFGGSACAPQKGIIHRDLRKADEHTCREPRRQAGAEGDRLRACQARRDRAATFRAHVVHGVRQRHGPRPCTWAPRTGHLQRRGRGYAGRRVCTRHHPVRIAHRHHATDARDGQEGGAGRDAQADSRTGGPGAKCAVEFVGLIAERRRQPAYGTNEAGPLRERRAGLDRDEGLEQGTRPPLRNSERVRQRRRALPESRGSGRRSAEFLRTYKLREIRPPQPRASDRGKPEVLVALLAGIIGTTVGLIEAKRKERLAVEAAAAENAAKLDADARRQEAERNLAFARKGNDILGSVFMGLDPDANYATVAELRNALRDNLAKAVSELDGSAIGDPLEVATMQNRLGRSLFGLGEATMAIGLWDKSLAIRKERLGADDPDTLQAMSNLATGYYAAREDGPGVAALRSDASRRRLPSFRA